MVKIMKSPVERAADEVRKQRGRLGQLQQEKAAAERALAGLQRQAPEEFLDDETGEAVGKTVRRMAELRDRIDIIGRTIPAQQQRVTVAERGYLEVEADEAEKPLIEAKAALTRHQARTNALLHELEAHEGRYMPENEYLIEVWSSARPAAANDGVGTTGMGPSMSVAAPKSAALVRAVAMAERPVQILRAMAEGREPVLQPGEDPADVYPPCVWGPDALVQAPAYAREVASLRRNLDTVERRAAELEERLANARARYEKTSGGQPVATKSIEAQLARIPDERAQAAARLHKVTGEAAAAAAS